MVVELNPLNSVANSAQIATVRELLNAVCDPEIPVMTIAELGILRDVQWQNGQWVITITPSYVACPAMSAIEEDIIKCLHQCGYNSVVVNTVLSPAWTTEWMSETAKQKLIDYGIAPPMTQLDSDASKRVVCPQCKSQKTELISAFGSTACKSLYRCTDCLEPFDYFKCL